MIGVIRNRMVIVSLVVGILLGTLVVAQANQHNLPLEAEGLDISETIFKDLDTNGIMPVFDMTGMESYEPSFHIDSSLWDQPLISLSEAYDSAIAFLLKNLNSEAIQNISIDSYYLGNSAPTIKFGLVGNNIRTQVHVNAISGDVIGWNLSSIRLNESESSNENGTHFTPEIAEQSAFDFLEENNYSIPDNARYLGVREYPSDLKNYYIIFRHFEGVIPVGMFPTDPNLNPDFNTEGIVLRISKVSGLVTQFGYKWIKVSHLPTNGIISEWDSNRIAQEYFESENATFLTSKILLLDIDTLESSDGSPQIRLSWVNYFELHNKLRVVFIDAYTGEVLQELRTNGPPPDSSSFSISNEENLSHLALLIFTALSAGCIFAIMMSYCIRTRHSL